MTILLAIFVGVLLLVSLFFHFMSVVSMYRFPGAYNRIHGVAQCTTGGTIFCVLAVLAYALGRWLIGGESRFMVFFIHTAIAGVVLLFTNPNAIHALARAMHRSGLAPEPSVLDHLEEKNIEMKKREGEGTP